VRQTHQEPWRVLLSPLDAVELLDHLGEGSGAEQPRASRIALTS
jgi:hypothetical protein